jgi:hypothetical protein
VTATETSRNPGLRRPRGVAAAVLLLAAIGLAIALAGRSSAAQRGPFHWLRPTAPPATWKFAHLPSQSATLAYPPGWRPIASDPGTVSAALLGRRGSIVGYLNLTPRQGDESLINWPTFRIRHLRAEGDRTVRLIAAHRGLVLHSGHGSCLIDSYSTSLTRYHEIACLINAAPTTAVIVGAAPSGDWHTRAQTIERAIASFFEEPA